MTYIKYDILDGGDLRTAFSNNVNFDSTLNISSNGIDINSLISINNSNLNGGLRFQGSNISYTADVNFTSSIINFNNKFIISGQKVIFPSGSFGAELVTINGKSKFGSVSFYKSTGTEVGYVGYGDTGLYIGNNGPPPPDGLLTVQGNVQYTSNGGFGRTFFYDSNLSEVSISRGTSAITPLSPLTIFNGSNLTSARVDPSSVLTCLNSNDVNPVGCIQFVSQFAANAQTMANWNNYAAGFLLSGVPNTTNTKHWFIGPAFDGVGTSVVAGTDFLWWSQDTTITRENWLIFAYLESNTTAISSTIAGTGSFMMGYIREQSSIGSLEFTGQHRNLPDDGFVLTEDKVGLIVISSGIYCETTTPDDFDTTISINESLPKVKLSSKRNDKSVFGVISNKEDEDNVRKYTSGNWVSVFKKKENDHRLIINSVGEGAIWVTNINGNFENGDYITSCEIPGYGMRQDAENLKNYTVAKITCDCNFNLSSSVYTCEEFQFSGSTYRRAFVGCTYHCG